MDLTEYLARTLPGVPRPSSAPSPFAHAIELRPQGKRLASSRAPTKRKCARSGAEAPAPVSPVFQLEPLPLTLNPSDYENPVTESSPKGSYATLAAFRQLTDPAPAFARYYSPSAVSTEGIYGNVITGAVLAGSSAFTSQIIAGAQKLFSQYALANMGGVAGSWHPVYACPSDWYDVSQTSRFTQLTIDLESEGPSVPGFATLPGSNNADRFAWLIGDPARAETQPLDPGTTVKRISFQALRVDLLRPWLAFELFQTQGWRLEGQPAGLISTGGVDQNTGILPLIATGLLVGINLSITANWAPSDQKVLRSLSSAAAPVSLGPFALFAGVRSPIPSLVDDETVRAPVLQVIGWISKVVPLAPSTS